MIHKGIDLILLTGMVFLGLFVIGKLQDRLPHGVRKVAMHAAPIPTGVVGHQSMSTFLMIALVLLLANEMGGGTMLGGSRKPIYHHGFPTHPPSWAGSRKGSKIVGGKGGIYKGSQKGVIGSGGLLTLDPATSSITPRRALKGGILNIGGDRCGKSLKAASVASSAPGVPPGMPAMAPSIAIPGTATDVGGEFQKQQDALGALAMAGEDTGKSGMIFV